MFTDAFFGQERISVKPVPLSVLPTHGASSCFNSANRASNGWPFFCEVPLLLVRFVMTTSAKCLQIASGIIEMIAIQVMHQQVFVDTASFTCCLKRFPDVIWAPFSLRIR